MPENPMPERRSPAEIRESLKEYEDEIIDRAARLVRDKVSNHVIQMLGHKILDEMGGFMEGAGKIYVDEITDKVMGKVCSSS